MMELWKKTGDFCKNLIAINKVVTYLVTVLLSITSVTAVIALVKKKWEEIIMGFKQVNWIVWVIFAGVVLLLCVIICIQRKRLKISKNKAIKCNNVLLNSEYEVISKRIYYEYVSKDFMIYKKTITIRALKDGVNSLKDKYCFTGDGDIKIRSSYKDQKYVETMEKSVYQAYEIHFARPLKKGEKIKTELVWEINNIKNMPKDFMSTTIQEECDKLSLIFKINTQVFGKKEKAKYTKSKNQGGSPIDFGDILFNYEGDMVTWNIDDPEMYCYYELDWG